MGSSASTCIFIEQNSILCYKGNLEKCSIIFNSLFCRLERTPTFLVPITNPLLLTTAGTPLCHLVCHLPIQFNTDNTDNWNNTKLSNFLGIVDFSVSCSLCVPYEKAKIFSPEDFKSLVSTNSATPSSLPWKKSAFPLYIQKYRRKRIFSLSH